MIKTAPPRPVAPPTSVRSKIPIEPAPRLKYLIQECLETDNDDEEARDLATKTWNIVADVQPEQTDLIAVAVATILKSGDDMSIAYMGKILQFTMRLRKWIVAEHNKDKKSLLIPKLLKVLFFYIYLLTH